MVFWALHVHFYIKNNFFALNTQSEGDRFQDTRFTELWRQRPLLRLKKNSPLEEYDHRGSDVIRDVNIELQHGIQMGKVMITEKKT